MRFLDGEESIHELRPDVRLLVIWFFTKHVGFLTTGLVGGFAACFGVGTLVSEDEVAVLGVAVACGVSVGLCALAGAVIYYRALRRTYVYYVTNRRCVFRGGILRRVERSVPYHKITDVEVSQNILERVLGIATLSLFTPGTASTSPYSSRPRPEICFAGLRDADEPAATINGILKDYRATGE